MSKINVLHTIQTARGGAAVVLHTLISELDRERYEPVVLFYVQEQAHIGEKLTNAGIKVITLAQQPLVDDASLPSTETVKSRDIPVWLEARFGRVVREIYVSVKASYEFIRWEAFRIWPIIRTIRENQINLIHLHTGLRHGKAGIIAAWLTKTPCLCHIHQFTELNYFDKIWIHLVNIFIYISRAIAEDNIRQGIPLAKGIVVHNAVNLGEFSSAYDAALIRSEFGWNGNERVVGVVGRLDWWKGHEYFLEAMAKAIEQMPNLRGLIIGEPEIAPRSRVYFQKLHVLTKSLELGDKIVFTGFRSDVRRLISALDVVVLSSATPEPFGLVVIEAMALGKPVVATAAGGPLDIIEDGVNGILVPCQDATAMAQAILELLSNQTKTEQISRAGRQRIIEKFTITDQVAAVQSIYDTIMNGLKNPSTLVRSLEDDHFAAR